MTIFIYNSLTQKKEPFRPIKTGKVSLYVCGMTVYDYLHLGHARILITFDMITRYFRHIGYEVNYVRNITDIDDKIIERARQKKQDWKALTHYFIEAMHKDEKSLGLIPPTKQPKATDHIPQMIQMIEILLKKNYAYRSEDGDIYYAIDQLKSYGELAKQDIQKLQAGHRIAINENKRNPLDFVLWKQAKPQEPYWHSPFGKGRPGWHLECSAMSTHYLGCPFDLHGGGVDLKFPHHQNEIAQSQATYDCCFVNQWLHVGYVQMDSVKMSKSLGNFLSLKAIKKHYPSEVLRYFFLQSHYRSPINYTDEHVKQAQTALTRLYHSLYMMHQENSFLNEEPVLTAQASALSKQFHQAMEDDFNTPKALAVLFSITHAIQISLKSGDKKEANTLAQCLKLLANSIGLLTDDPKLFLQKGTNSDDAEAIEKLISARNQARIKQNWHEADIIRKNLLEKGVILEDTSTGTHWKKTDH